MKRRAFLFISAIAPAAVALPVAAAPRVQTRSKWDPDYHHASDHRVKGALRTRNVTLDGSEIQSAIECNTREGWVVRYIKRDGQYVVNGEGLATETIWGAVCVTWAA